MLNACHISESLFMLEWIVSSQSWAAWPRCWNKSSPSFFNSWPKSILTSLSLKSMVFTTSQKVTKHLCYFGNKNFFCQEIPKIAQYGHTEFLSWSFIAKFQSFLSQKDIDEQCHQIGRFLKVLGNTFCYKIAQIFGDFLGFIEKHQILIKNF